MTTPQSTAAMPPMMYGTAWKEERTADLVYEAIKAGFRGIDTAAMKKHYDEALTGEGIRRAINEGIVSRRDLFIQTKFTPLDPSSPYSLSSPIPTQIHDSVASSLANLSPPPAAQDNPDGAPSSYLDALLLHSPFPTPAATLLALQTLQLYLPGSPDPSRAGKILRLGISNVPLSHLLALYPPPSPPPPPPSDPSPQQDPRAPPISIIQNRFYSASAPVPWDGDVRAWCAERDGAPVAYQGFWTLTGNTGVWRRAWFVRELAGAAGLSPAAAWYVLARAAAGVVVLNGTGDRGHMREDLAAWETVERWRAEEQGGGREAEEVWERCLAGMKDLVGG